MRKNEKRSECNGIDADVDDDLEEMCCGDEWGRDVCGLHMGSLSLFTRVFGYLHFCRPMER